MARETLSQRTARRLFPADWSPTCDRIRRALTGRPVVVRSAVQAEDSRAAAYLEAVGHQEAAGALRARARETSGEWWTARRQRRLTPSTAAAGEDVPPLPHAAAVLGVSRLAATVALQFVAARREISPARRVHIVRACVALAEELALATREL